MKRQRRNQTCTNCSSHPWLIEPGWDQFRHEPQLDKLLTEEYHIKPSGQKEGGLEPDFFCLQSPNEARVVEIKRPGDKAGKRELTQISDYVHFLREYANTTNDPRHKMNVEGVIIVSAVDNKQSEFKKTLKQSRIYVWDWNFVLRRAKDLYKEYFDHVLKRGPQENPVIKALSEQEI